MFISQIRQFAPETISSRLVQKTKKAIARRPINRAKMALSGTTEGSKWLDARDFETLGREYPVRGPSRARGDIKPDLKRARQVLRQTGSDAKRYLEIGGGHGLTAWGLALAGKDVTVLDRHDEVAPSAVSCGVRAVIGDACSMPFDDSAFDVVYSYNAFEQIEDAETAALEAGRVVKPGGTVYLNFAPIYNAPLGLQAFHEIGIPYAQHLWPEETLSPYLTSKTLRPLNRWSLRRYREMCWDIALKLQLTSYDEGVDLTGLDLIERFPACFAKRSRDLDEFIVSKLVMTFRPIKLPIMGLTILLSPDLLSTFAAPLA